MRYRPLARADEDEREVGQQQATLNVIDALSVGERGDILVFLSTERGIRDTAEALRKHRLPQTEVLALYARLSAAEQDKVFQLHD